MTIPAGPEWVIWRDPPPIPTQAFDWHYRHRDFDGPEDVRFGHSSSCEGCLQDIQDRFGEDL